MINNVTRLREIQLELLDAFARVCAEHDLKWCICFGTLLGKVRCGGYLPWDDDLDMVMPEADFRELCLHKEWFAFDDRLFLQTPLDEGLPNIGKLRMNGTTAFREKLEDSLRQGGHHGIPIDIIPLNEVPGAGCYKTPSLRSVDKLDAVYLKDWFFPATEGTFEGHSVKVPAKPRKILTEVYDEWAWPSGAMDSKPTFWFFDTERDYTYYVKKYTGMLEGIEGKKIYLFGAADSLRIWMERFNLEKQVICTFDNDPNKWGKKYFGVEVRNPKDLPSIIDKDSRVIIVSLWHQEIGNQLESMGINDYYVYLDFYYDDNVGNKVVRREDEKKNGIEMWKA